MEIADVLSEDLLRELVDLLVRLVEAVGALVVFVGVVLSAGRFAVASARRRLDRDFTAVRLGLGRYLALGLEFQLASDILSTAVAPSFEEIGKLAAIAAVRTLLNHFLEREIDREREEVEAARAGARAPGSS